MLSAPVLLAEAHQLDQFRCGNTGFDDWLRRRAPSNQESGTSRTYVITSGERVVGYYCLSSGTLDLASEPLPIQRNVPDPLPIAVLGRLAIDSDWQGKGLGTALLQDAVLRTALAADILGIRGILAHAISDAARLFYERYGFTASPNNPMTLMLSLRQDPKI